MAEGARLESVFRLIPNEGSNPSLSAIFKQKAPWRKPGGFLFDWGAGRLWFEPWVRPIRQERIGTHLSAAPKGWRAGRPE